MRRFALLAVAAALVSLTVPSAGMQKWRMPPPDEARPEVGCEFPDFPLSDTDGNTVWFNDYRGRPMLVAFCSCYTDTACAIIETLERIRTSQKTDLFTVIVCCETAPALAEEGYRRLKFECRDAADLILIDPLGETLRPFRVEVLPTAYLVDGEFCVRHRAVDVGELNTPAFRESLSAVLEEYPAGN